MTDPGAGGGFGSNRDSIAESPPKAPLWVKVLGLLVLLVLAVFLFLSLARGPMRGAHGPARHTSLAGLGAELSTTGVNVAPGRRNLTSK